MQSTDVNFKFKTFGIHFHMWFTWIQLIIYQTWLKIVGKLKKSAKKLK